MKNSYKNLSYKELEAELAKLRKELIDLRLQKVLGHLDNPMRLRTIRRDIARLNTRIHAVDIGIAKNGGDK
ncbi:MAG: 50S ribosomal protein L29 [Spirochaetes bacterium]|uniref:Large ribosomal subunit protein uL29 n=1 Tax=Candidatus Ornithospirochaeta stercoravium TaxID=2840897 RepID=A0A9D9IAT7_9SPIO|nr:50S ribosomal protein L29 [Candidatus Ornithospirochaeta stercoravium]